MSKHESTPCWGLRGVGKVPRSLICDLYPGLAKVVPESAFIKTGRAEAPSLVHVCSWPHPGDSHDLRAQGWRGVSFSGKGRKQRAELGGTGVWPQSQVSAPAVPSWERRPSRLSPCCWCEAPLEGSEDLRGQPWGSWGPADFW